MKLALLAFVIATTALALTTVANADESDTEMAGKFAETCKSHSMQDYCLGYVRGVSDVMDLGQPGGHPCVPGETTNRQLLQIALTVEAVTWNRDVFVRLTGSYRDCSRLTDYTEVGWSRLLAK